MCSVNIQMMTSELKSNGSVKQRMMQQWDKEDVALEGWLYTTAASGT